MSSGRGFVWIFQLERPQRRHGSQLRREVSVVFAGVFTWYTFATLIGAALIHMVWSVSRRAEVGNFGTPPHGRESVKKHSEFIGFHFELYVEPDFSGYHFELYEEITLVLKHHWPQRS